MIHDYEYEQAMPYKYIKYRKQDKDEFSEEIKSELDNYYRVLANTKYMGYQLPEKSKVVDTVRKKKVLTHVEPVRDILDSKSV